jgi:carbon storage regulator
MTGVIPMLILSRRINESLQIGPNITVKVLGIYGQHVRLGLTAPRDVVIDRAEVHQRKLRESAPATLNLPPSAPPSTG